MKKRIFGLAFAFIVVLGISFTKPSKADEGVPSHCTYTAIPCGNWSEDNGYVEDIVYGLVCDLEDWDMWREILC